jgi:similar to stage IV sporulation protein
MLLLRLWNYLRGYVIIVVEGYFLEKFINICIHRQIFLWDINRQKNCTMTLKVSIKGFKLLKPIVRKTKCRVKIAGKRGFPFVISRYRRRKTFVVGAFAFIFLFYILTSFIWAVEITGNEKISSQVMIDKLADCGAKPGVFKFKIKASDIVNSMMRNEKDLAWIGVSVKGTKIKVSVVERVKPPNIIPKDEPCNIVAYRDGVIKSVFAKIGQKAVKPGETVVKGQLLVSGTVVSENKEVAPKKVHASGQVFARTWYESKVPVEQTIKEQVRTGNKKDNYTLVLFSRPINLFHRNIDFENYDKIEIKKRLSVGEDLVLPFGITIDRYYEDEIVEKTLELEDSKKLALDKAQREAEKDIPEDAKQVSKDENFIEKEDGSLEANVIIECLEDIGVTEGLEETN